MKIWPRRKNVVGGIACMPLKKNIPVGNTGWKLTECPQCHRQCWENPMVQDIRERGGKALCTECALSSQVR